ncbi:MAG: transketolase [bacterium]
MSDKDLALAANVIRGLAMDGVQAANSGHPGMPMGAADYAATLFLKHLNHNPADPAWPNRDRFVLSGGHGAMLLYSMLHLSGYDLPMSELKAFRQWGSRTPGHPEFGHTPGVETTTGPLGQGCAMAVGMALAERMLAERFNAPDITLVDHRTYVICGDGDLMEGISHEAFSLAGHLKLAKLTVIFDSNKITIEGSTDLACSDDVRKRFEGYGWNVLDIDGHNIEQIDAALTAARNETTRPTMIIARTHIAQGSPNLHDTAKAHGEPLGAEEIKASKKNLGLPEDKSFHVPPEVYSLFAQRKSEGAAKAAAWGKLFDSYKAKYPEKSALWEQAIAGALPADLADGMPEFSKPVATRVASGTIMQKMAKSVPYLVGGSADLAPSTKTLLSDTPSVGPHSFVGRNLHFGIREHAMGAMLNGLALHGGFRPFGATFFVFLDYCRPAVRLSAIMGLPVIYIFTHDSFYVGEDGPTHEPIEQLASLRCMPNVVTLRPADATETAAAWVVALRNKTGPTVLMLTRQNLPVIDRKQFPPASMVEKGGYTLWESAPGTPDLILIGSGSEVPLAMDAAKLLAAGKKIRVVSMPSWELFEKQPQSYRDSVLPAACTARLAVEAGSPMGWERYIGSRGRMIGMNRFGASAPCNILAEKFGFTVENVVAVAKEVMGR